MANRSRNRNFVRRGFHNIGFYFKNFLKEEDMFASGVNLQISRGVRHHETKKKYSPSLGSVYGGFLTLVVYFLMVVYLYHDIEKMRVGKTDIIQTQVKTNKFVAPDDMAEISNFEFLPSIHMKLNDRSNANVDRFKNDLDLIDSYSADNDNIKFNPDELKKYI